MHHDDGLACRIWIRVFVNKNKWDERVSKSEFGGKKNSELCRYCARKNGKNSMEKYLRFMPYLHYNYLEANSLFSLILKIVVGFLGNINILSFHGQRNKLKTKVPYLQSRVQFEKYLRCRLTTFDGDDFYS